MCVSPLPPRPCVCVCVFGDADTRGHTKACLASHAGRLTPALPAPHSRAFPLRVSQEEESYKQESDQTGPDARETARETEWGQGQSSGMESWGRRTVRGPEADRMSVWPPRAAAAWLPLRLALG